LDYSPFNFITKKSLSNWIKLEGLVQTERFGSNGKIWFKRKDLVVGGDITSSVPNVPTSIPVPEMN
jgi:hypothetical protein